MPEHKRPSSKNLIGFTSQTTTPAWKQLTRDSTFNGSAPLPGARLVPITAVVPNPNQPRQSFNAEKLEELAADIRSRGILQPLIVRPIAEEDNLYQIVVGERRYQAAKIAGLSDIPVRIMELADAEARLVSLVENLQREDLDIADEARFLHTLMEESNLSTRQLGTLINKSHMYVDSRLRLLASPTLLEAVKEKQLGLQEAIMLSRIKDQDELQSLLEETQENKLSREDLRQRLNKPSQGDSSFKTSLRPFNRALSSARNLDPAILPSQERAQLRITVEETIQALTELHARLGEEA